MPQTDLVPRRCEQRSSPAFSFERYKYCSLIENHTGPHTAYKNHNPTDGVYWLGPWEDNTPWLDQEGNWRDLLATNSADPEPTLTIEQSETTIAYKCIFCHQIVSYDKPKIHSACPAPLNYFAVVLRLATGLLDLRLHSEREWWRKRMRDGSCGCRIKFTGVNTTFTDHSPWCTFPQVAALIGQYLVGLGYKPGDVISDEDWEDLAEMARKEILPSDDYPVG